MSAAVKTDGISLRGAASFDTPGYGSERSWLALVVIIAAGFVPSMLMISRSAQRRRDGPMDRMD